MGVWASGMLSALGAGGPWFDPALAPSFYFTQRAAKDR